MIDPDYLRTVKLTGDAKFMRLVGRFLRHVDHRIPKKTKVTFEHLERLPPPGRPIILAMNHTDRFNYWPLQLGLHMQKKGLTATWVKGKYYENKVMASFLSACNGIPLPSRGYVITTEFRRIAERPPESDEYRSLRTLVDEGAWDGDFTSMARRFVNAHGGPEAFKVWFEDLWSRMIEEVTRLNQRAFQLGLYLLVFPQGTRSIRLSRGQIGLVQMAQHLNADIVPVGCNGSDKLYPGNSPFSKGGTVHYRIGEPMKLDSEDLAQFRVHEPFVPFSPAAKEKHGDKFRGLTDLMMDRINDLLDPEYQFSDDQSSDGVKEMNRFV
ncbi:MAG: lysophospholipid acyltransferase family protein [Bradymonadia bacterium]